MLGLEALLPCSTAALSAEPVGCHEVTSRQSWPLFFRVPHLCLPHATLFVNCFDCLGSVSLCFGLCFVWCS